MGWIGVFLSWATFFLSGYGSLNAGYNYISEYGGWCGTCRMTAQFILMVLVPVSLLFSGLGWFFSHRAHYLTRSARLGFIATALFTIYCLVFISFLPAILSWF
jgi:hypothetical protein